MTATEQTKVLNHLNELNQLIGIKNYNTETALSFWRSLRRLECHARRVALLGCNNSAYINSGNFDKDREAIENKLKAKFLHPENVFFNTDARGYSLKVDGDRMRNEISKFSNLLLDWGGNVTIAPEI